MTVAPHFHIGIVVENIERGIATFARTLGLTFHEPISAVIDQFADPVPRRLEPRFTYSHQGPPYIELVEMNESRLYHRDRGEGLHHLGVWTPDVVGEVARLQLRGLRHEASILKPDGSVSVWFNDPADLHGTRIEFLDEGMRSDWEESYGTGPT